ncbi:hypothetical protein AO203_08685 [Lactobacillus gallinarum]|nr:hypothetical protein AO203_08685 [Lactobacillus gallinarum]
MEYHKINQDDLKVLSSYISDPARFITNPTTHWDHDQFKTVRAMPDLVIQPVTNEEVQKVVKYASDHNIPIVPRGNSTDLMGANLTDEVDFCVPINHIPDVLHRVDELEKKTGMRIPNFGQAGDGNLHIYLCSDNMSDAEYKEKSDKVITELYKTAKALDGNMSGEYGIGYARKDWFEWYYGEDYTNLLRKIKKVFDPNSVLNPDKIFPLKDNTKLTIM